MSEKSALTMVYVPAEDLSILESVLNGMSKLLY